jgi:hypothetical protein
LPLLWFDFKAHIFKGFGIVSQPAFFDRFLAPVRGTGHIVFLICFSHQPAPASDGAIVEKQGTSYIPAQSRIQGSENRDGSQRVTPAPV